MSSFTQQQKPWKKELVYKPTRNRKVKKSDMCVDAYVNLESHTSLDIDPCAMTTGKMFDVDTQIEKDKKIDPAKVFQNYKEPPKTKNKEKDNNSKTKKTRHVGKSFIDKKVTIKYGL